MKMAPGSHRTGRMEHTDTHAEDNILHRGQEVRDADLSDAIHVELAPVQASPDNQRSVAVQSRSAGESEFISVWLRTHAGHARDRLRPGRQKQGGCQH